MGLALIEKIIALFLMLFAGFALVKKDILKTIKWFTYIALKKKIQTMN